MEIWKSRNHIDCVRLLKKLCKDITINTQWAHIKKKIGFVPLTSPVKTSKIHYLLYSFQNVIDI